MIGLFIDTGDGFEPRHQPKRMHGKGLRLCVGAILHHLILIIHIAPKAAILIQKPLRKTKPALQGAQMLCDKPDVFRQAVVLIQLFHQLHHACEQEHHGLHLFILAFTIYAVFSPPVRL